MRLNIKTHEIQELATNGNTYMKGRRYYNSGQIHDMTYDPANRIYRAQIQGSNKNLYRTEIEVSKVGRPLKAFCSCKAFENYHGCCKHLVAAMLLASSQDISEAEKSRLDLPEPSPALTAPGRTERDNHHPAPKTGRANPETIVRPTQTDSPFSFLKNNPEPGKLPTTSPKFREAEKETGAFLDRLNYTRKISAAAAGEKGTRAESTGDEAEQAQLLKLECTLTLPVYSSETASLTFRFGFPSRLYVLRNVESFLQATLSCEELQFGKLLTYKPLSQTFTPFSEKLMQWLLDLYQNAREKIAYSSIAVTPFQGNSVTLNPARLKAFLNLFLDEYEKTRSREEDWLKPELYIQTAEDRDNRLVGRDFTIKKACPPLYFELSEARWEERSYPAVEICILTARSKSKHEPVNFSHAYNWQKAEPCYRLLSDDAGMLMGKDSLYLIPEGANATLLKVFYKALSNLKGRPGLVLTEEKTGSFLALAKPLLKEPGLLSLSDDLKARILTGKPTIELYLDTDNSTVTGKLLFKYGQITVNPHPDAVADAAVDPDTATIDSDAPDRNSARGKRQILIRHAEMEKAILEKLIQAGFTATSPNRIRRADLPDRTEKGVYYLSGNEAIYEFLTSGLSQLQPLATIYYSTRFQKLTIQKPPQITGHIRLDESLNLLSLNLDTEQLDPGTVRALLSAYREKRRFLRLKNGNFFSLENFFGKEKAEDEGRPENRPAEGSETEENQTDRAGERGLFTLLDKLDNWGAVWSDQGLTMPSFRALSMNRLIRELKLDQARPSELESEKENTSDRAESSSGLSGPSSPVLTADEPYLQLNKLAEDPASVDFPFPNTIKANPRSYQVTGFNWFCLLNHYGFAGILADEMGLGKTLQALSFLCYFSERIKLPSLVIAPTSLIYNWKEETERFAPHLKTAVLTGTAEQREKILEEIDRVDLLIASYTVQRMDSKQLQKITFGCCILDEAQAIKNPATHTSRAVKKISALRRFALTGTPIENALHELWSIFDFLMPGYLLSRKKFQSRFEQPIVRDRSSAALEDLNRLTSPFILRRLKKDVLKELPDKIETRLFCEMEPEQEKLYRAYLSTARQSVKDMIDTGDSNKHRIEILSLLTRLRQICCHPALFLENYKGRSGKLETLNDLLDSLFENGARVLLFSQFTSMLDLIRKEQEKRNRPIFYIDGSVKSEDRIDQVNRFNQGERDLFLISLKAGGTGLNLTGANAVIHYDPWWNPAVEQQATDRAHRIGQKDVVQIFRLIARHSIEEKIDNLKSIKKDLVEAVIKPNQNPLSKLTEEELISLFEG